MSFGPPPVGFDPLATSHSVKLVAFSKIAGLYKKVEHFSDLDDMDSIRRWAQSKLVRRAHAKYGAMFSKPFSGPITFKYALLRPDSNAKQRLKTKDENQFNEIWEHCRDFPSEHPKVLEVGEILVEPNGNFRDLFAAYRKRDAIRRLRFNYWNGYDSYSGEDRLVSKNAIAKWKKNTRLDIPNMIGSEKSGSVLAVQYKILSEDTQHTFESGELEYAQPEPKCLNGSGGMHRWEELAVHPDMPLHTFKCDCDFVKYSIILDKPTRIEGYWGLTKEISEYFDSGIFEEPEEIEAVIDVIEANMSSILETIR